MIRTTAALWMASVITLASTASAATLAPVAVPRPPESVGQPLSLDEALRLARSDASRRLGVDPQAVETVSADAVTWRDGGIGCTAPGLIVTMALVPGYRIRLRVQREVLGYHASARGALLLCPQGLATEPLPDSTR